MAEKSSKLQANIVQYGSSYKVIGGFEENLNSSEAKKQISQAQIKAQQLMQDALIKVDQTINQAQAEAEAILQQAQKDGETIQAQAQEAGQKMGYDAGYQAGYNQAVEEAQSIIDSAETIINGAYQAQNEILKNTEKQMIGLIIAIAKKVIHKEVKTQPDIILRITEASIKELKERETVKIMVNPKLINTFNQNSQALVKRINSLQTLKIIEDKSVPENGIIVESSSGKIDGSVDTQIEEIFNKLMDEATSNPALINTPQKNILPAKPQAAIKQSQSQGLPPQKPLIQRQAPPKQNAKSNQPTQKPPFIPKGINQPSKPDNI